MYLVSIFSNCIVLNICVLTFFKWLTEWDSELWKKMKLNFQLLKVSCKSWFAIYIYIYIYIYICLSIYLSIYLSILYIYNLTWEQKLIVYRTVLYPRCVGCTHICGKNGKGHVQRTNYAMLSILAQYKTIG